MKKTCLLLILFLIISVSEMLSSNILVPMDDKQSNHLKAYGLAYWAIDSKNGAVEKIHWLLNYRGGSFLMPHSELIIEKSKYMGVSYEIISDKELNEIEIEIQKSNMDKVELQKAPKIAVYAPPENNPWDDAVTLALTYAEIPFDKLWDDKIIKGALAKYDWLHSHHEDFTGQYDKFYRSFHNAAWYISKVRDSRKAALEQGFVSVREQKLFVAKTISEYVKNGGFFFAMCSAPESIDIALALEGTDFIAPEIDGTPYDRNYMDKIDYEKTIMFESFKVIADPNINPKSDIDYNWVNTRERKEDPPFELFEFSAKFDQVPSILTQNHNRIIKGFFGLTSSFRKNLLKKQVTILGTCLGNDAVKYIHRKYGKGTVTYLGGHDPEDYAHKVGAEPTNLNLYKNSEGYRLILNNVLFPAVKKKKLKT